MKRRKWKSPEWWICVRFVRVWWENRMMGQNCSKIWICYHKFLHIQFLPNIFWCQFESHKYRRYWPSQSTGWMNQAKSALAESSPQDTAPSCGMAEPKSNFVRVFLNNLFFGKYNNLTILHVANASAGIVSKGNMLVFPGNCRNQSIALQALVQ